MVKPSQPVRALGEGLGDLKLYLREIQMFLNF